MWADEAAQCASVQRSVAEPTNRHLIDGRSERRCSELAQRHASSRAEAAVALRAQAHEPVVLTDGDA
jgi:hypothetical protein